MLSFMNYTHAPLTNWGLKLVDVQDGIELRIAQTGEHGFRIVDVGNHLFHTSGHLLLAHSSVQQPQFMAALCQLSGVSLTFPMFNGV